MKWELIKNSDRIILKYRRRSLKCSDCELSHFSFYLNKLKNDSWTATDSINYKSNYLVGFLNAEVVRIIKDKL
jgi:hypothetical protein